MSNNYEKIVSLMFAVGRNIRDHGTREDSPYNPSLIKLEIMKLISKGGLNMRDVTAYLCTKAPTTTSFVNDLVKSKLVSRKADRKDRRSINLSLTTLGQKVLIEKYDTRGQHFREVLAKLTSAELTNMEKTLEKIQKIYKDKK